MDVKKEAVFYPIVNGVQKMALYKTQTRYYLIGSNNTQTRFRILKIDRTEPYNLVVFDDKVEYNSSQIKDILSAINEGNRSQSGQRQLSGLSKSVSAFGIIGFIKFLEGYYIILITKRRKVATIGLHSIYKVEDTSMLYIPHESVRKYHEEEQKYVKLFNNVDLSSNFYFSYSYNLTQSLQYNLTPPSTINPAQLSQQHHRYKDALEDNYLNEPMPDHEKSFFTSRTNDGETTEVYSFGVRDKCHQKFVWNSYLLRQLEKVGHPTWILPIIHGFIDQSNISVYGRPFYLTLIARRSCRYAGTRFLKRGANFEGDVANEVETEQIVHDAHVSSSHLGHYTSYVQIRGSIPGHWSQDISKMVPKPPISLDLRDPYAETAGKHFNQLLCRFGAPVIVLNLVKKRERRPHESILSEDFSSKIQQLNITLPPHAKIRHIHMDMARIYKDKDQNVMSCLSEFALKAVKRTGIFQNFHPLHSHILNPNRHYRNLEKKSCTGLNDLEEYLRNKWGGSGELRQTGIIRVNCVDCLDRTNTAQFALGKCALGFQLYALGVLEKPFLEFDSDCVRILEEMYEDHGDTLALQYGGSQLVHRICTYRKTAPWSSHGNDIMQTLSRYYSNTFSDLEKQNSMNLFLGVYVPSLHSEPLWELVSDYNLHQSRAAGDLPCHRSSTVQWWHSDVMDALPYAADEVNKTSAFLSPVDPREPKVDLFDDYYHTLENLRLSELFAFDMRHSVRDYVPTSASDESPFVVRKWTGKRQEQLAQSISRGGDPSQKNPCISGQASTSSTSSNTSSSASSTESEATDEDTISDTSLESESQSMANVETHRIPTFGSIFPPPCESYGELCHSPSTKDRETYCRFVSIQESSSPDPNVSKTSAPCAISEEGITDSFLGYVEELGETDTSYEVKVPSVSPYSLHVYASYVSVLTKEPEHKYLVSYRSFVALR